MNQTPFGLAFVHTFAEERYLDAPGDMRRRCDWHGESPKFPHRHASFGCYSRMGLMCFGICPVENDIALFCWLLDGI